MILTDYLIEGQNLTGEHSSLIVGTTHFTSISPRIDSVTVNGRSGVMLPPGRWLSTRQKSHSNSSQTGQMPMRSCTASTVSAASPRR